MTDSTDLPDSGPPIEDEAPSVATFSFEWDPATDRIDRSPESAAVLGLSPAVIGETGESFLARLERGERARLESVLKALSPESPTYRIRYRLRTPSGRPVVLDEHGRGVFDSGGRLIYLLGISADATERQRAEQALRRQERRLRMALAAARGGTWCLDPVSGRCTISAEARLLLGLGPEESLTRERLLALAHPPDRPQLAERLDRALAGRTRFHAEFRTSDPATPVRWLAIQGELSGGRDGRLLGLVQDISEQREMSEALRHEQELFQSIIDRIPVMVTIFRADLRAFRINREFERVLGRDLAELDRPGAFELCYPGPEERRRVREAMRASDGAWRDLCMVARDGTRIDTSWVHLRLSDDTRVGIGIDVRPHKRAEEALREADRRKDEFLAMIGHELRTPLTPIRNAVELLRLRLPQEHFAEQAVNSVARHVSLMERLLDDLLDTARITQGKLELRRESVALARVIDDALELVRPRVDGSRHRLRIVLPDPSPHLRGDPARLAQVFANLIDNAAKYTDPGGDIAVEAHVENGSVVVRVSDSGRGIGEEELPHLFDAFTQGSQGGPGRRGLGLGLAIVRQLVELHGGTVHAESAGPGQGARFSVRLPLGAGGNARARTAVPVAEPSPGTDPAMPQTMKVLLVEDDTDIAESTMLLLEALGHPVELAVDGARAIEMARIGRHQVVLLDIGLRDTDGYEVARALRRMPGGAQFHIAAITGFGDAHTRALSREAGIDRVLVKPVGLEAFRELLTLAARGSGGG